MSSSSDPHAEPHAPHVPKSASQAVGSLLVGRAGAYYPGDNAFDSIAHLEERFNVDAFNKAVNKGSGGGMMSFIRAKPKTPGGTEGPLTVEHMLAHNATPMPTSLLKHSTDAVAKSVKMSPAILRLVTDPSVPPAELAATVHKLVRETIKDPNFATSSCSPRFAPLDATKTPRTRAGRGNSSTSSPPPSHLPKIFWVSYPSTSTSARTRRERRRPRGERRCGRHRAQARRQRDRAGIRRRRKSSRRCAMTAA